MDDTPTVYVVQADSNKDLSDAKRFGNLRAVFSNPHKPYNTINMVNKARDVLDNWLEGDYLLMIGDPVLCAVCMSVVTEVASSVNVLSWDRVVFQYIPQVWHFDEQAEFDFNNSDN